MSCVSRDLSRMFKKLLDLTAIGLCSTLLVAQEAQATAPLAAEYQPHDAEQAKVPAGFKIEKIFEVPRSMGSWVSLAVDPQGRIIACDQGDEGLFMIEPGDARQPTRIQRLPLELTSAQGLLWAFDSLWVMVNGGPKSGLHRATDSDGDGLVDTAEHCMHLRGGGEHGPHAIVLAPDGQSLYVCSGNHTKLPESVADSLGPRNWQEDLLLPRRWDANGHAAGLLAPGGWICRVDPSGKHWTVVSTGYRNQYDIAFNADGELFSYDADMEWDFGSPWYRPTRVVHATSGSEFGWRSGTGKWPEYYADSLPAAVNIGPGSPTGIVFGYGTKFPAKYQQALFILDWTYSTIYSVHLKPSGASYTATFEDFVTGSPLPVTDAVIGQDGGLYFAVGGRGTQSAIYRVTYAGGESVAPVELTNADGQSMRKLRHSLEQYHGSQGAASASDADVQRMVEHLGHADRFIRYAARTALEQQPVTRWRAQVLAERDSRSVIYGLLALARQGLPQDLEVIAERLLKLPHEELPEEDILAALRTLQVACARRAEQSSAQLQTWQDVALSAKLRERLLGVLEAVYPTESYAINAEISQLLVFLESPVVVEKTLDLMDQLGTEPIPDWGYLISRNTDYGGTVGKMMADMPPVRGIQFAFVLRNVKSPWTLAQRERYFEFYLRAAKHPGGASYAKFLENFREDALLTCTESEKIALGSLVDRSLLVAPIEASPPQGPGRVWTSAEALAELRDKLRKRSYDSGRNLYHATGCAKCHRLAGEGGAIGPDLSTAGKKFSLPDLIDALIDPSRVISDQYGSHQVVTLDGDVHIGRAVEIDQKVHIYTADFNAKPIVIARSDIDSMSPSNVSQMPTGLLDALNAEELRDLIAYLLAAGNPGGIQFK
ncbi:MAG: c-type cytochrome [Pirellulaceae bacterium]|nr:c-type cytochrome [Pirellulaceae bacterium]